MMINHLLETIYLHRKKDVMVWNGQVYSYQWLNDRINFYENIITNYGIKQGSVVEISGSFSPEAITLLIVLLKLHCIIVPISSSVKEKNQFREISEVEFIVDINIDDKVTVTKTDYLLMHSLLIELKKNDVPGLILFSSGSTGKSKAAAHNLALLLEKFKTPRMAKRIMTFLSFDHIGGINTLFYTLYNGGCIVTVKERSPAIICEMIEKHKVQVLPTTPTFLNLLLISSEHKNYDLNSLELITYGTEVMQEHTLQALHAELPAVKLLQTYGLSEVGILRSKSKENNSLFMKIGGENYQTRIVDNMFEIKATSAMMGYLNAPSPFTKDGWFKTDDMVEVDGDYIRILGRKSEIINVGGEKVYPAEVESVIQAMDGVQDVAVVGAPHPIMGNIVSAKVKLLTNESISDFRVRMRLFCKDKLQNFKIPQQVIFIKTNLYGERFKKMRNVA